MMHQFGSGKAEKNVLVKFSKTEFAKNGWKVNETPSNAHMQALREQYDFEVSRDGMDFVIVCVAGEQRHFYSLTALIKRWDDDTRQFRRLVNRLLVVVVSEEFSDLRAEEVLRLGVYVINVLDLSTITELQHFDDQPPPTLSAKQRPLYQGNPDFCAAVAARLSKSGCVQSAIAWSCFAVESQAGVSMAHMISFDLLVGEKRFKEASTIGLGALDYRPNHLGFLRRMRTLAVSQNRHEEAESWNKKISSLEKSCAGAQDLRHILTQRSGGAGWSPDRGSASVPVQLPRASKAKLRRWLSFVERLLR